MPVEAIRDGKINNFFVKKLFFHFGHEKTRIRIRSWIWICVDLKCWIRIWIGRKSPVYILALQSSLVSHRPAVFCAYMNLLLVPIQNYGTFLVLKTCLWQALQYCISLFLDIEEQIWACLRFRLDHP